MDSVYGADEQAELTHTFRIVNQTKRVERNRVFGTVLEKLDTRISCHAREVCGQSVLE